MSSLTSSSEIHHESESKSITTDPEKNSFNVYLSFCNQDKGNFLSRLEMALSSKAGIVVFGEDERFLHGEQVKYALNVIGDCKIAIVVFSINYTNSTWCLKELEKITECCRTSDLILLPAFYDGVNHSYGNLKRGMFGEDAFHDFIDSISIEEISKEEDKFMSWVAAISKPTTLSGPKDLVQIPTCR